MTEAVRRVTNRVHDVKPGETKFVGLARIDVPEHERGDERYRQLKGIARQLSEEWQSFDAVVGTVEVLIDASGPWAQTSTEYTIREGIEAGLLEDRRNDRGEPEVRVNPTPPLPKTQSELLEEQVERAAAQERQLVAEEIAARERVGREHAERIIAAERQTTREHMAPVIDELRAEVSRLRELIESSQGTEE
jgi:hypothetical protein